jgi:hypothetical protein
MIQTTNQLSTSPLTHLQSYCWKVQEKEQILVAQPRQEPNLATFVWTDRWADRSKEYRGVFKQLKCDPNMRKCLESGEMMMFGRDWE